MDNYKAKYEMLLEAVEQLGSEPLKEIAEATKRLAVEAETVDSVVTKEEFKAMGYTERVRFKNEHPQSYELLNGGN